jgi:glycyl-tRNA synthetase (class II)
MSEGVVTVRDRDSMAQEKVGLSEVGAYLDQAVRSWKRA